MRISGRTPWTVSAPAAKRSRAAAVLLRLTSASIAPLVAGDAPFVGSFTPFLPGPLSSGEGGSTFVISGRTDDLKRYRRARDHHASRQAAIFQGWEAGAAARGRDGGAGLDR